MEDVLELAAVAASGRRGRTVGAGVDDAAALAPGGAGHRRLRGELVVHEEPRALPRALAARPPRR